MPETKTLYKEMERRKRQTLIILGQYDATMDTISLKISTVLLRELKGRIFRIDDAIMPRPEDGSMTLPSCPKVGDVVAQLIMTEMESLGEFDA